MKKKLVENEKEILDVRGKIKEKDIPKECSSSRNPCFHIDEHHNGFFTDKPHVDKLHVEEPKVAHTRKALAEHIIILKRPAPSVSYRTGMTLVQPVEKVHISPSTRTV